MLYLNLSLASLTLVCMGIVRFVHRLRPRWLSSVLPGMRWKFFFICFGLAIVALIASVAVSNFLPSNPDDIGGEPNKLDGTLLATGIVILLTTPLQAHRGGVRLPRLPDAGVRLAHARNHAGPRVSGSGPCGSPSPSRSSSPRACSRLAHGAQNFPLFFDRFAFGLMAGLLVILVGGLEAGIALHILNNLLAFAVAIVFGDLQGSAHGLRGVLVAASRHHRAERRLPAAGAARRTPDGAVRRTTPPVPQTPTRTSEAASRRAPLERREPAAGMTLPRLVGDRGVCVSLTRRSARQHHCGNCGRIPWGMG